MRNKGREFCTLAVPREVYRKLKIISGICDVRLWEAMKIAVDFYLKHQNIVLPEHTISPNNSNKQEDSTSTTIQE